MNSRLIKDAVHGYIEIDPEFELIIDSPEFLRLKQIEQGSFRVLFPAARHDRYVHSLGTYQLSKLFSESLVKNIEKDVPNFKLSNIDEIGIIKNTFKLAALLHDVGHAPFSHTTENFFTDFTANNKEDQFYKIKKELKDTIKATCFINIKDYQALSKDIDECDCNPHEIMSAIIMARLVNKVFSEEQLAVYDIPLAVRMIIGSPIKYIKDYNSQKENDEIGLKNCFIRLLNSSIIDVDKLDYLTRDMQMSGFDNVVIDIDRLAMCVSAVRTSDGFLYPAYRKRSLSVIDNVFRAKSQQSLWFFNHPLVIYETNLIRCCIFDLNRRHENYIETIFTSKGLSPEGVTYHDNLYYLLSDTELNNDFKYYYRDHSPLIKEILFTEKRHKSIWCSYYEFLHFFNATDGRRRLVKEKEIGKCVYNYLKPLIDYMNKNFIFFINEELLTSIKQIEKSQENVIKILENLKSIFDQGHEKFEFVLLNAAHQSNIHIEEHKIKIIFETHGISNLASFLEYDEINLNKSDDTIHNYFYIYVKEEWSEKFFDLFRRKLVSLSGYNRQDI